MISDSITISDADVEKLMSFRFFFKKLLYHRLTYVLKNPFNIKFLFCLVPSSLIPPSCRIRNRELKDEVDILYASKILNRPLYNLTNYYTYLNYKIFYTLTKEHKTGFFVSLDELRQIFLRDQYCVKDLLKSEAIVLDCGANIGLFSILAHHLSPKSKIYSFEPTKYTFEILEKNIKENNFENFIHPLNLALGDRSQEIKIQTNEGLGEANSVIDSEMKIIPLYPYSAVEKVKMITIDDFVKWQNLRKVDFIKIDTEGYEKQVIKGAKKTIKEFHPIIACSAYHLPEDKIEIPKLILEIEASYKYRLEKRSEEDFVFWY